MTPEPVIIIGVGPEGRAGLSQRLLETIAMADEVWGSDRLLAMWPELRQKKVSLGKQLTDVVPNLKHRLSDRRIVILASGDPSFYGIAASVLKIIPTEEVIIYPQISFLQAAFAKVGVPWNDAVFTSAHVRPITEVIGLAWRFPKVGILTDSIQNPAWIGGKLIAAGIPDCRAVVIENLGERDEKIIHSRLAELQELSFAPLNVLLLIEDSDWKPAPTFLPHPDNAYRHKKGLITKSDVRTISISRMGVRETDIIWDIGAGSGAVSIEMAELAWRGRVFAIEKEAECLDCLRENVTRFGTTNIEIVEGEAPQALESLTVPDAVFIGGSSGKLIEIFSQIQRSTRDGCRIVANFTVLENLIQTFNWMKNQKWDPVITEASFSYGTMIGGGIRLVPANPVFILNGMTRSKEAA